MSSNRPPKVLVAKAGLDGHDRGVKIVARALRDAGVEVVYLGLHNTPAEIVNAAIQEDVDAVGLSILSGAHRELFPDILARLRAAGGGDILVFAGGVIPDEDVPFCEQIGVRAVFGPGTSIDEAVRFVRDHVRKR
jgi:methylmalonyl-CoA mutase C-terminal domain/subunit